MDHGKPKSPPSPTVIKDAGTTAFPPQRLAHAAAPMRLVLLLAAYADVDVRSAKKAIEEGGDAVRGRAGERIREAAAEHNIVLGLASVHPSRTPNSAA